MAKLPTVEQMKFRRYPPLKSGPPILWPTKRYFRRNEGSTDYATIPEVTLSGDFVIEFEALYSGDFRVLGTIDSANPDRIFAITDSADATKLRVGLDGVNLYTATGFINLNEVNKVKIERTGSILTITNISTGSVASGSFPTSSAVLNVLYQHNGTYTSGILANLKIYDAGTLVRDYPLDDNSDILANRAASLGQELVVNGDFSDGLTGWSALSNAELSNDVGKLKILNVGDNFGKGYQAISTESGKTYRLSFINTETNSSLNNVRVGTSIGGTDVLANPQYLTGVNEFIFTAESSTSYLTFVNDGVDGHYSIIDNISIREADGYGTIINGNADDWGLFDRQADGDWLGQELVVNGGFDSDSGWVKESEWSISDGSATMASTSSFNTIRQSVGFLPSLSYRVSLDVVAVTGTVKAMEIALAGTTNLPLFQFTANGNISKDVIIDSAGGRPSIGFARELVTSSCSIDNVSVKEVLKNA